MSDLTNALDEAGIAHWESKDSGHEPKFEFFDDEFIAAHGNEAATLSHYWTHATPTFICVSVRDYDDALWLYVDLLNDDATEDDTPDA